MRKLTLHVLDIPILAGTETSPTHYPHDGLFLTPSGMVYLKKDSLVAYTGCMAQPNMDIALSMAERPYELSAEVSVSEPKDQVSFDNLLRAIAVARKPKLVLEMGL